jgi:NADPH:quinone reductase-like Zn-dependent oxidoreductase
MSEAAAMPETLFTVWINLFERGFAADGDTVLVHGGTSGIGTMAIKLGNLFGLEVIVTCGSDEKCAAAIELGAAHAINYAISIPDLMRRRLTLTGSTLRTRDIAFKTMVRDEIAQTVWPYVEGNRLKPVMDESFPLEEAAAAHARMEAGDHVGKIVLTTDV